jgi:hypothetical protein
LGGQDPEYLFGNFAHARLDVVQPAHIHVARPSFAEIGEPQSAGPVEHQVIRAFQLVIAASVEYCFDFAARQIDTLNRAADVLIGSGSNGHHHAARSDPAKPAVVADIALTVRTDCSAIRTARDFCNDLLAAIGPYARQLLRTDFHQ